MQIILSNNLTLENVPKDLGEILQYRLTMPNPAYADAVKMGRWTGNIPRTLECFTRTGSDLLVPRGFIRQAVGICRGEGVRYEFIDHRRTLPPVSFTFKGTLKPFQEQTVKDVLARDFGTLSAPTGSGKTVMALSIIAQRRQPALILVHNKELLHPWEERASTFLDLSKEEIGIIGDGKKRLGGRLTIGIVNSVYPEAERLREHFGHLIVDEVHRCPSRTFTQAVKAFDSRFMLGLSATVYRRDGLGRLIWWYVGDLVHKIEDEALKDSGDILRAEVIQRPTTFRTSFDPSEEYSQMLSELTENRERNALIAADVVQQASNGGGICLVLSDRKAHCEALSSLIRRQGVSVEILTGDLSSNKRQEVVERLNAGAVKVLCATGQLIGEGFDCKALSTLFLATPIKFSGRLIQYLGRVLRPAPGKDRAKVYDYVDAGVSVLRVAAEARARVYES